jgi:hypothetical protein
VRIVLRVGRFRDARVPHGLPKFRIADLGVAPWISMMVRTRVAMVVSAGSSDPNTQRSS